MKTLLVSGAAFGLLVGGAAADSYKFAVDPARGGLDFSIHDSVHISGTFIGDYDAQTNPTGTKTRNGYYGGKDNEAVAYTTDASVDGGAHTAPAGGFTFNLDPDAGTLSITGFSMDLLNGAAPAFPLTVALDFKTFRTFNPDSLYIGGILPPIEVGEATIHALSAAQSGAGGGNLTPSGQNAFDFEAVVAADLTIALSVLGQDVAPPPQPTPLALVGTITLNQNGTATVVMTLDQQILQDIPLEGAGFDALPLDLPTILPPGGTAHLLMSGTVDSISLDMTIGLDVIADGQAVCTADFDGNGVLDFFDFLAFQNAFAAADPSADFNGDGAFDLFDFLAFVNAFNAGC